MKLKIKTKIIILLSILVNIFLSLHSPNAGEDIGYGVKKHKPIPPKLIKFKSPVYPESLRDHPKEAEVILRLYIDEQGKVVKSEAIKWSDDIFIHPALHAAMSLIFQPAMVDHTPQRSVIRFRYRFTIKRIVKKPKVKKSHTGRFTIQGIVLEMGTRRPVAGIVVYIGHTRKRAITDKNGRFKIDGIDQNKVLILVDDPDYQPYARVFKQDSYKNIKIWIKKKSYSQYETVVRSKKREEQPIEREVTKQEIWTVPGTRGDVFKVAQDFPGTARTNALVVMRGSAPEDTLIYIEKHYVPYVFHFGGLTSVINPELVKNLKIYPGGQGVKYGFGTAGALDATLRKPRKDRYGGIVDINMLESTALLEGPLGKDYSIALSGRRSYFDTFLGLVSDQIGIDFAIAPRYYDYQLLITGPSMKAFLIGVDDKVSLTFKEPPAEDPVITGIDFGMSYQLLAATWIKHIDSMDILVSPGALISGTRFRVGHDQYVDFNDRQFQLYQELNIHLNKNSSLLSGIEMLSGKTKVEGDFIRPPKEDETRAPSFTLDKKITTNKEVGYLFWAVFSQLSLKPLESFTVTAGSRFEHYDIIDQNKTNFRIALKYRLSKSTVLRLTTGTYTEPPTPDEMDPDFGNPSLMPEQATQTDLGMRYDLSKTLHFEIDLYYKDMKSLVVSYLDRPDYDPSKDPPYVNDGVGFAWGLELLLRKDFNGRMYGWIGYTFSKSMRKDHPDEDYRPFSWDQTHNLIAVLSILLPHDWQIGTRFRYVTGNPYTPVVSSIYYSNKDIYMPVFGKHNSMRFPPFHQLDLRVDKKFIFDLWILDLYLDFQNVYFRINRSAIMYQYDYAREEKIGLFSFGPALGIRGEF